MQWLSKITEFPLNYFHILKFHSITLHYVEEAIDNLKMQPQNSTKGREESILEKLIKIDKKVAVVMCIDNIIAGVDTTSSAVIAILYCLAKNQDKQEKLRSELLQVLPEKNDSLTAEKMQNMPYLNAVIKEGIRLYPPTVGTMRSAGENLVLSGYRVPKNTDIVLNLMMTNTEESKFPQAQKFIPERWIKDKFTRCPNVLGPSSPFCYLPFGFGSRMCIGRRLAELEIQVLLARLIREFRVDWHYEDLKISSVIVNIPVGDLKFQFTEL